MLLMGCTNTKLLHSWENKEKIPKHFDNLAITAITPNNSNRYITERAIVEHLKKDGYKAVPTYETLPFAGRIAELSKTANSTEGSEGLKKIIRAKMEENHYDGLMVLSVFNKKTEDRWVNDRTYAPAGAGYYGVPFGYAGRYYDYYYYSMGAMYNSGYYVKDVTYYIECNLYDVVSEDIVWSGQISVKNIESMDVEADKIAYIIADQIDRKKVLTRNMQ